MRYRCSIIIVSWNVRRYLERCLLSIARHCSDVDYSIVVVDNASTDETLGLLKKYQRTVLKGRLRVVMNDQNVGFASAVNQGVRRLDRFGCDTDDILLLNPDVEFHASVLPKLLEELHRTKSTGVVGPTLFDEYGVIQRSVVRLPGLWSSVITLLKLHHILYFLPLLRNSFAMDMDYTKAQVVEQVQGAFFLIRRDCWDQLDGLDPHFFIWYEEVDFCKRAIDRGWVIRYQPLSGIVHHGGRSFVQERRMLKQRYYQRSLLWYMAKHKGFAAWLIIWCLQPIGLLVSGITAIFPPARAVWTVKGPQL